MKETPCYNKCPITGIITPTGDFMFNENGVTIENPIVSYNVDKSIKVTKDDYVLISIDDNSKYLTHKVLSDKEILTLSGLLGTELQSKHIAVRENSYYALLTMLSVSEFNFDEAPEEKEDLEDKFDRISKMFNLDPINNDFKVLGNEINMN